MLNVFSSWRASARPWSEDSSAIGGTNLIRASESSLEVICPRTSSLPPPAFGRKWRTEGKGEHRASPAGKSLRVEDRETIRLTREINSRSFSHNRTKSDTFCCLLAENVRFFGRQNRTEINRFHNFRTFFYCPCKPFLSRRRAGTPRPAGKGEKVCRQEDLPAGSRRLCHAQSRTGPALSGPTFFPRHLRRYRHRDFAYFCPNASSIVLIIVTFASTAKSVCITVACTSGSWPVFSYQMV